MSNLSQLKSAIKHHTTFHQQGPDKNIFIFSMPRSGTTWLMEIIATQPGFKIVNEPFNIRKDVVREHLGLDAWNPILDPAGRDKIAAYMNMFLEGKDNDPRFFRYAPFSEFWKLKTDRILFKVLFAGEGYFDWFKETFNGQILYLLRHPIPVSLSRDVCPRLESFMTSGYREHFTPDVMTFAEGIVQKGDKFEMAVLDWCFENAVPLRQVQEDWMVISYEQMVLEPETILKELIWRCNFASPELMFARLDKASNSTAKSNAESQQVLLDSKKMVENKRWLVEKWVKKVSEAQIDRTFEILDRFGIDFYVKGNVMPASHYLIG
ncbi:MAG: sulfotransferase [Bacteroidia bacterium]|nr:sulfotransferase [Bacteroidia bacterium]